MDSLRDLFANFSTTTGRQELVLKRYCHGSTYRRQQQFALTRMADLNVIRFEVEGTYPFNVLAVVSEMIDKVRGESFSTLAFSTMMQVP
jgi:hypothetical protein